VRLPEDTGRPPLLVWADRETLGQILLDLLSNAVKFTPAEPGGVPGRVTVELSDADHEETAEATGSAEPGGEPRADEEGERAYLWVSDTGVGIPRDKLEAVFEPFVQVRSEFTRAAGGTGLGLAISRDLARGMSGDLRVRSTAGVGSTFTLVRRRMISVTDDPIDRRTGEERRLEEEGRHGAARRDGERDDRVGDAQHGPTGTA
jgi:signal transduction histidine kinase